MKARIEFAALAFLLVTLFAFAATNIFGANPPGVELHLSAVVPERRVGGPPIRARVELWNEGKEDFIAGAEFAPILNAPSFVKLEFVDERGTVHAGSVIYSNFSEDGKSQWWTRIAPHHYYGEEFDLDLNSYPFLDSPGIFKVSAKYVSKGRDAQASTHDPLVCCRVWAGEIASNTVSIRILPPETNGSAKH
jgi:hypothetical protein